MPDYSPRLLSRVAMPAVGVIVFTLLGCGQTTRYEDDAKVKLPSLAAAVREFIESEGRVPDSRWEISSSGVNSLESLNYRNDVGDDQVAWNDFSLVCIEGSSAKDAVIIVLALPPGRYADRVLRDSNDRFPYVYGLFKPQSEPEYIVRSTPAPGTPAGHETPLLKGAMDFWKGARN